MNKKLELLRVFFWVLGGIYVAGGLIFAVVGVLGGMGIIDRRTLSKSESPEVSAPAFLA